MNTVQVSRSATAEYTLPVPMGSPLGGYGDNSGYFWAAAMSQGANRNYGDAYGTYFNPSPTLNNQYDAQGYQYAIEVPVGAGATNVDLYDPAFCAGVHQRARRPLDPVEPEWLTRVSVYFILWSDPAATPLDHSDDVRSPRSGTLSRIAASADKSVTLREGSAAWPGHAFWSLPDCTADPNHNAWWTLATLTSPGTYRLQVHHDEPAQHQRADGNERGEQWALRAVPTDPAHKPRVYGLGKMVIYANVANGTTLLFYLGRIEAVHAGKTMVIQLFNPGDASGDSEHRGPPAHGHRLLPHQVQLHRGLNATGSKSGTNVLNLPTTINGTSQYNNSWVTITVRLPKTYVAPLRLESQPERSAGGGRSATTSTAPRPTRRPGRSRSAATRSTSCCPDVGLPDRMTIAVLRADGAGPHQAVTMPAASPHHEPDPTSPAPRARRQR